MLFYLSSRLSFSFMVVFGTDTKIAGLQGGQVATKAIGIIKSMKILNEIRKKKES